MRFGRMEKRFNHNTYENIISTVETLTGKTVDAREKDIITRGAEEVDLVRSGLEETMITAYQQIRAVWLSKPDIKDMRTAAFVCALQKIGSDYENLGIFP